MGFRNRGRSKRGEMMNLLSSVLEKIRPSKEDEDKLQEVVNKLLERARKVCEEEGMGKPMLVGSAARNTWLKGEKDIDIFILLPETLPREKLEEIGLRICRKIAGGKGREKYAEHPYVTFEFEGFEVDLVPCYEISDPRKIKSAVDRSPHHQAYVSPRLTPALRDQVLLLKQFMKGLGVYGAELKIHGFSGYLCELLILHAGGFLELLKQAANWKPGQVIDLEKHYPNEDEPRRIFENQPLIVVDPVDPGRNVAASVSLQAFTIFVRGCQDFLANPREEFFFPKEIKRLRKSELVRILRRRGTEVYCIVFKLPDLVPDVLYPQLRKTERALVTALTEAGHKVIRSDVWGEGTGAILLEVQPSVEKMEVREGPPLGVSAENFVRSYLLSPIKLAGPFINPSGRVVYELKSHRPSPEKVIRETLKEKHLLGKNIGEVLQRGYRLLRTASIPNLLDHPHLSLFISDYFTKCLPWYR
jgi:tRNA nucleotidyltransferase (CCA-adding enzyme)